MNKSVFPSETFQGIPFASSVESELRIVIGTEDYFGGPIGVVGVGPNGEGARITVTELEATLLLELAAKGFPLGLQGEKRPYVDPPSLAWVHVEGTDLQILKQALEQILDGLQSKATVGLFDEEQEILPKDL